MGLRVPREVCATAEAVAGDSSSSITVATLPPKSYAECRLCPDILPLLWLLRPDLPLQISANDISGVVSLEDS